jgi:hypothetical protein
MRDIGRIVLLGSKKPLLFRKDLAEFLETLSRIRRTNI